MALELSLEGREKVGQVTKGESDTPGRGESRTESREAGKSASGRGGTGRQYCQREQCRVRPAGVGVELAGRGALP